MNLDSLISYFPAGVAVAVTGTRHWHGPLPAHAEQLIGAASLVLVGDADGVDTATVALWRGAAEPASRALVIFAIPNRTYRPPSPVASTVYVVSAVGDPRGQRAYRSQQMINALGRHRRVANQPAALIAVPSAAPAPAGLRAAHWPNIGSGTWGTVGYAAYCRLPILAFTPYCPPALAGIDWQPVAVPGPGPDELAHLWRPAPSLLEEPFDFQLCTR